MKNIAIVSITAIAISGCAGFGWSKPGGTQMDFDSDNMHCTRESASLYPTVMVNSGLSYQAPVITNCSSYGSQINCFSTPGASVPPTQTDANALARIMYWDMCIRAQGWKWGVRK